MTFGAIADRKIHVVDIPAASEFAERRRLGRRGEDASFGKGVPAWWAVISEARSGSHCCWCTAHQVLWKVPRQGRAFHALDALAECFLQAPAQGRRGVLAHVHQKALDRPHVLIHRPQLIVVRLVQVAQIDLPVQDGLRLTERSSVESRSRRKGLGSPLADSGHSPTATVSGCLRSVATSRPGRFRKTMPPRDELDLRQVTACAGFVETAHEHHPAGGTLLVAIQARRGRCLLFGMVR